MRKWFFYLLNFKIMTERELIISQSIFDFWDVANKLQLKKVLFQTPMKVLEILEWNFLPLAEEVKERLNYLLALFEKLNRVREVTVRKWFWYSDISWNLARNITDYTFNFTPEQVDKLRELVKIVENFYIDRLNLLKNNPDIQRILSIKDSQAISMLEVPLFTRLDLILDDEWNFKIAEIEPIYAWIGECMWARDVNEELWVNDVNFIWLKNPYLNAMRRYSWEKFLFFPNKKLSWYYNEVQYVFDSLYYEASLFCNLDITFDENDIFFLEDWLYFKWEKVDVLMYYFIPKEQWDLSELDKKILKLYKEWKIKLFPEASLELDSKLWLALVFDNNFFPENYPLKEFLPRSSIYSEATEVWAEVFTKRVKSRVWRKDVMLWALSDEQKMEIAWDDTLWITQEKVTSIPREVVLLNRKWKIEREIMYSRIELYIFFWQDWAELWDVLVTMAPTEIVKWWKQTVMVSWVTKDNL
jgi:hypothetical protein